MMLAAFAGHVLATHAPTLLGHPVDMSFVNFSLTQSGLFFYPYYVLFAASGFYLLTHGAIVALRALGVRLPADIARPGA